MNMGMKIACGASGGTEVAGSFGGCSLVRGRMIEIWGGFSNLAGRLYQLGMDVGRWFCMWSGRT